MEKLTEHEQKMLDRLRREGTLHWTSVKADDTRTLNRLVKKGAARETVGRAGRKAWEPLTYNAAPRGNEMHGQKARLVEFGMLATIDEDGTKTEYPMALLIEFDSPEAIRKAIHDGYVRMEFI